MRILVGNNLDPSIHTKRDVSGSIQRILWFARDGDLVVLPTAPDPSFMRHVTSLTGVDLESLRLHIAQGALTESALLSDVAKDLRDVSEVWPMCPSLEVARFARELGIADLLPGSRFMAQGGGALANSKAHFRALAAGAGVNIPFGEVCCTERHAATVLAEVIERHGAAVVKQAHNSSGNGNQIVAKNMLETSHIGARHLRTLGSGPDAVAAYWADRWEWASASGRFPVVVEELVANAKSVYSEHYVGNDRTWPTGTGVLDYSKRTLRKQIVPLHATAVGEDAYNSLVRQGSALAEVYRAVGYRGFLSADALIDPSGDVWFTEVNAQVSGSLHLYGVVASQVADAMSVPERTVAEYDVPAQWHVAGIDDFLAAAYKSRCVFDPIERTGVIVTTAPPANDPKSDKFMFCVVSDDVRTHDHILRNLAGEFVPRISPVG